MKDPVDFAIDTLAVARVTRLVVEDKITEDLRYKVIGRYQGTKLAYLVTCQYCVSVWAGLAVVLMKRLPLGRHLVKALALSQATIYVRELDNG